MAKRKRTTPLPGDEYLPSEEEIRQACLAFQSRWSPAEECRRRLPHLCGDATEARRLVDVCFDPVSPAPPANQPRE